MRCAAGGNGEIRLHRDCFSREIPGRRHISIIIERRDAIPRVRSGIASVAANLDDDIVPGITVDDHEFHGGDVDEHHEDAVGDGIDIGTHRIRHDPIELAITRSVVGVLCFDLCLGAFVKWLLLQLFNIDVDFITWLP